MSVKEKEYGLPELGEALYRENCAILTSKYIDNIAFTIYYPENAVGNVEPHLMIYKYKYSDDVLKVDSILGFCRLSVIEPKYITGYNEDYILTKDEIRFIYNELIRQWSDNGSSRWDYINECMKYNYDLDEIKNPYNYFIQIPDYLNI